jgi:reprolysin-like metallo-peptidase family M12B
MRESRTLARLLACGAATLVAVAVPGAASAATPPAATLSQQAPSTTWKGGPFTASNPAACAGPQDPTCDRFELTMRPERRTDVRVAVTAPEGQDIDLFVTGPDGSQVPHENSPSHAEQLTIHEPISGRYTVTVQPFTVEPGTTYEGVAQFVPAERPAPAPDAENECLEPVPAAASVRGITDEGQQITLATTVLLDGVTRERAQDAMARAADSYAPLGVTLTARYQDVAFTGDGAQELIDQAKARFGGSRPRNADLVYVLTSKDIQAGGNYGVAGMADCIGGVRFDSQAFAVGEVWNDEDLAIGPLRFYADTTAKIAAHELGHLMGGHHHYANCAEGTKTEQEVVEVSPCTLMFNFVDFQSVHFSTLNRQVVRGHAVEFASP